MLRTEPPVGRCPGAPRFQCARARGPGEGRWRAAPRHPHAVDRRPRRRGADGRRRRFRGRRAVGPWEPIPLRDGAEVRQGRWLFRLRHEGGVEWGLDSAAGAQWNDVHGFTDTPFYRADYTIFSHYLSTHPRSPFRRSLVVQRSEDTVRHTLTGTRLTAQYPDATTTTRGLDPKDVAAVLRDVFGIELDHDEASALSTAVAR
ncbi:arylamine N-acetyltransferase family protein [Nocardiopsis salina]|uniref:arylamine N-acetyltransferase family protein n=1 Tax=Nocardiopsis salina TaxID=245836 RepID=UPI00373AE31F